MKASIRTLFGGIALCVLSGCGNDLIDLSCDDPELYQEAVIGSRLVVPEDMDNLDPAKEMPVPDAAALQRRASGEPCLDIPPRYLKTEGAIEDGEADESGD